MKKYLKIFIALFNIQAKKYAENRLNTFGSIFITTLGLVVNILLVESIFTLTKDVNGWNKQQVFLLIAVFRIYISIFSLLFLRSINTSSFMIANGELDWFLTKPVSSQFLTTFRQIRSYEVFNLPAGFVLFIYAVFKLGLQPNFLNVLSFLILLLMGLVILYSILYTLSTLTFWVGRFDSISSVARIICEPLSIPMDFLGKSASFILTFIIPLGFIITIPVKILLNLESLFLLIPASFFALLLFYISNFSWNISIKRYTSASS